MKRFWKNFAGLSSIVLVLSTLAIPAARAEGSEKESGKTAPEAVLAAFHKAYPQATIKAVAPETKNDSSYFEIESMDGQTERNILYRDDGSVYEIEETIPAAALPGAVTESLKASFPNATVKKVERIERGDIREFEVLLINGEDHLEVLFDSHGKVITKTQVAEDEEKADDKEDEDAEG